MPTIVALINWTDQGVKNYKDTVDRVDQAQEALDGFGVRIRDALWTIGPYDIVVTFEAPDEESVTAGLLALAAQGIIRSTTMRAFDRTEMRGVLERSSR